MHCDCNVTRRADGQLGGIHSPAFEAEQNLAPTLRGLAHPVFNGQEPLLAKGCHANNYKGAELVIFASKAAVGVKPDTLYRYVDPNGNLRDYGKRVLCA